MITVTKSEQYKSMKRWGAKVQMVMDYEKTKSSCGGDNEYIQALTLRVNNRLVYLEK